MVCLAVLRHCPSPSWQGAFFAHVHAHMGAFNPQELANVLTAAGVPACEVCDMPYVTYCIRYVAQVSHLCRGFERGYHNASVVDAL